MEPDRNQQTAPEARSEQLREAARARMEAERLAREAQQNAAQGDTNIHVNPQPPRQTPPQDQPKLEIPTRPRPGAPSEPTAPARGTHPQQERPQSQAQPRPARPDTPRTDVPEPVLDLKERGPAPRQPHPAPRPAQSVNWGNLAITVLKVAAIGLVAFAGAAFLSGFIGTALAALVTVPAVGVAVNSTVGFVGPLGAKLASGVAWLGGMVSAAFSGIGAGLGISGGTAAAATAATAATPAVVDPATMTTISNGTKALLFGGAAAAAAPFAAKAMASTPMIDTSAAHTASGHEHAAQAALGKKAVVQQQVAGDAPQQQTNNLPADRSGLELPDLPEELAATHSKTAATKAGHHAAEHGHAERRHATDQLRRGASASNSWAEQVGREEPRRAAPKPRASEFTAQIDQDRAALDAALGEPSR